MWGGTTKTVRWGWTYDGVVITKSQTSVYEDLEWIQALTEWFRAVHGTDIPTLGVCCGHQLAAQALGGRVVNMGEYELGYQEIKRTEKDPLFDDMPQTFTAFESHSDRISELPPGATRLAANNMGVQAYRIGNTFGVQFHPEYDLETARWVVRQKDLSRERIDTILQGITKAAYVEAKVAARVFDNFTSLARNQADHTTQGGEQAESHYPAG